MLEPEDRGFVVKLYLLVTSETTSANTQQQEHPTVSRTRRSLNNMPHEQGKAQEASALHGEQKAIE